MIGSGPDVDTICLSCLTLLIRMKALEILYSERREVDVLGEGGGEAELADIAKVMVKGKPMAASFMTDRLIKHGGSGRPKSGHKRELPSLHNISGFFVRGLSYLVQTSRQVRGVREREIVWSLSVPPIPPPRSLFLTTTPTMADPTVPAAHDTEPHPYLHEPVLYISGLPPYVTDDEIALVFQPCAKFRLKISREDPHQELYGTIEFQYLDRGHFHSVRFRSSHQL